jgi:hypothetical protein
VSFARYCILRHAWIHLIPLNLILAICDLLMHYMLRSVFSGYPIVLGLLLADSSILLLYHLLMSKVFLFYWRIAFTVVAMGFAIEQCLFSVASFFCLTDPPLLLWLMHQLGLTPIRCILAA